MENAVNYVLSSGRCGEISCLSWHRSDINDTENIKSRGIIKTNEEEKDVDVFRPVRR